jgi:predicted transcriptional regulator
MKKERIVDIIKRLPEEFELDELLQRLVFAEKIEKGLTDLEKGKTVSHHQVTEKLRKNTP